MPSSSIRVRSWCDSKVVSVQVRLAGGSRTEQVPGQASITGRMLAEGSQRRDWRQIAEQAEGLGMSIMAFGGLETIGVAIEALAQDWERAVEWAAELVFAGRPAGCEDGLGVLEPALLPSPEIASGSRNPRGARVAGKGSLYAILERELVQLSTRNDLWWIRR